MIKPVLVGEARERIRGLSDAAAMIAALCIGGRSIAVEADEDGLDELERTGLLDVERPAPGQIERWGSAAATVTGRPGW